MFNHLFIFLWHFALLSQESVMEAAPEAEDIKRNVISLQKSLQL